MKKIFFFLLLLLMPSSICFGQNTEQIKAQLKILEEQDRTGTLNTDKAITTLTYYYQQSKKIEYKEGISTAGRNLMINLFRKDSYEQAIKIGDDLLQNFRSSLDTEKMSDVYRIRGLAYGALGFNDKSQKEYQIALRFAKQIPDKDIRHYRASTL